MSARLRKHCTFVLVLTAAALAPIAAWEAPDPPAAAAPQQSTDEAAAASQETPESQEAVKRGDGVAAIVNDSVISNYDVRQRLALYMATSGVHPTADQLKEIREQVLKQLETERLQLLEAEKNKISVSAQEVDKAVEEITSDNHVTVDQLKQMLEKSGVQMATLRGQIAAQIAWQKLVEDQLGDRVHVSPLDVDDEFARVREGANKPHYLVSEIFQAVDTPEQDAKVRKDMDNLEEQLHANAPFAAVARQFSQNPTAAQGGDLGSVQEGQLSPELDAVLKTMHTGQISQPIRSAGGYYILYVREIEEPEGAKIPDAAPQVTGPPGTLPLVRILIPLSPRATKESVQKEAQAAEEMREHIESCANAKDAASHLPGSQFFNLGNMRLADLSPELQSAINQTPPGGSSPPLGSSAGIEIIVRCDKPVAKVTRFVMPTREQIEQQLFQEQISTLARQYLRDLRRDADVETR